MDSLVKAAKVRGIELQQSYARVGKYALQKHGRYAHAKQYRRARKMTRKLRGYLGRVIRDIKRKHPQPDNALNELLKISKRIYTLQQRDKGKLYSVHATEVECISKGKAHNRYEFGCKESVTSSFKNNWVLAVDALHGNPYDGHRLKDALAQAESTCGRNISQVFVDKGYRGAAKTIPDKQIFMSGARGLPPSLKRWLKRRSAVEPIIGHLKSDHRMRRNHLAGKDGDRINAILSGCGFNFLKILRALALVIQFICNFNSQICRQTPSLPQHC